MQNDNLPPSRGEPKVQCDTDMMLALLILAAEALNAREASKDPGHDRD